MVHALGYQMALSLAPCKSPILCPNFPRIHAIRIRFSSQNSISRTSCYDVSGISISASAKIINPFIGKAGCRSSLDSAGQLEEETPPNVLIFIKGLAQSTSEGALKDELSQFGEVSRVKIISDKKTKQSLGFAYVWFTREEHAQAAVEAMNGQFFEGRFIRVEFAKPGSCKPRPRPRPYKF